MAFTGGDSSFSIDAVGNKVETLTPVVWEHESIPYLQFVGIDIHLVDGSVIALLSEMDNGNDFYGLYLMLHKQNHFESGQPIDPTSIYRTKELSEFPAGRAKVSIVRRDGPTAVIEATIAFNNKMVRIVSGEIHERTEGKLEIVEGDESLLVQLLNVNTHQ